MTFDLKIHISKPSVFLIQRDTKLTINKKNLHPYSTFNLYAAITELKKN